MHGKVKTWKDTLRIHYSEVDSGLVKLVVMTNIFFNNQQHKIISKLFICVKQIKFLQYQLNATFLFKYM